MDNWKTWKIVAVAFAGGMLLFLVAFAFAIVLHY